MNKLFVVLMLSLIFVFRSAFVFASDFEPEVSTAAVTFTSKAGGFLMKIKKVVDFETGTRVRTFNSLSNESQPNGFATMSSDQGKSSLEPFAQIGMDRFAIEVLLLDHSRDLVTKFNGSTLGKLKVTTGNTVIGKFFFWNSPQGGASIGLGTEHTKIDGAVSMGGFKFPTTGAGWSPVFQIGGEYRVGKYFTLGMDYERSNVRIVTTIPGVPDLVSVFDSRFAFKIAGRW